MTQYVSTWRRKASTNGQIMLGTASSAADLQAITQVAARFAIDDEEEIAAA